jgi:hypothetical protein
MFAMFRASLNRKEKYAVAVLSLIAFALRVPLALKSQRELTTLPYIDDTYYLFSIARNLATGHGPSVDGIHLTNGFQPLIVILYTPIFWLCNPDSWLAVRWTFILNGAIAALAVWASAEVMKALEREMPTRRLSAPILAAGLWTGTFALLNQMTNGLETGLYSLFLLLAIGNYAGLIRDDTPGVTFPLRRWACFGILLGFTALARIDATILVVIFVIVLLIERRTVPALIVGSSSFLLTIPWWVYNWVHFGSLMPSSGQAENSWPESAFSILQHTTNALAGIASLIFYFTEDLNSIGILGPVVNIVWTLAIVCGCVFAWYRTRWGAHVRLSFRMRALRPFLFFSIALLVYYTFFLCAPWFIPRYLQPGRIVWSIFVAASVSVLWQMKPRFARPALLVLAVLGLLFSISGYRNRYLPHPTSYEFYEMGQWAKQRPQEKIGMLQSGIASFIAPNVINLDGKVNFEALRSHQQGRLAEYLRTGQFTYIADSKPLIDGIAEIARGGKLEFDSVGMIDGIQLMQRRVTDSLLK